jgi:hypothetical protein
MLLRRRLENVSAEWQIWCLTHNLLKLYRHSGSLTGEAGGRG